MGEKRMRTLFLTAVAILLISCSSTLPKVDHEKRYVRYFSPTEEMAYSVYPPIGSWDYIAGKYKNENTGDIAFVAKVNPYVSVNVALRMYELRLEFNDAESMERNKYFFNNHMFSNKLDLERVKTVSVGTQGHRCVKNLRSGERHYGPSRNPAVSGKWAGAGTTHYSYQTHCPFHMDGQHYEFWMDKTIMVADAAEAAGYAVDIAALNDEIDRRFEPVWQSIWFNPRLSQAPFPESETVDISQ